MDKTHNSEKALLVVKGNVSSELVAEMQIQNYNRGIVEDKRTKRYRNTTRLLRSSNSDTPVNSTIESSLKNSSVDSSVIENDDEEYSTVSFR